MPPFAQLWLSVHFLIYKNNFLFLKSYLLGNLKQTGPFDVGKDRLE